MFLLLRIFPNEAKVLLQPLMETDDESDLVIPTFATSGRDSVMGDYSHVPTDILEILGGAEELKARVGRRLSEVADVQDIALMAMYQSILTGKKFYLVDGSEGDPI